MNIILVGNGSSVLGNALGRHIDDFNIVVRFNNFQLAGYEKDVGTKSTFLVRRCCEDVIWHPKSQFSHIYTFIQHCKWTPWMPPVQQQIEKFYGEKNTTVGEDFCRSVAVKLGQHNPMEKWPSIGILAIEYFLQFFSSLTLYGFDGMTDGKEGHYFNKPPKDSCYHDFDVEQKHIQNLIKQDKVKLL